MEIPVSKPDFYLQAIILQCSGHRLILDIMGLWKAADCPFKPQKSPLLSQCFCLNNTILCYTCKQRSCPPSSPLHIFCDLFPAKTLFFSEWKPRKICNFPSFLFFFPFPFDAIVWYTELRTLLSALPSSLRLSSCHPSPPFCVTSSFCYLVYAVSECNCSV